MFRLNFSSGGPLGLTAIFLAIFLAAAAGQPVLAQTQAHETDQAAQAAPPDAPPPPPKVRTGKERLGPKWTDEQRTDNCKVPVDKRGATPRPDTCPGGSE
jgi:hypothetical protein